MNPYEAPQTEPIDTGDAWKDILAGAILLWEFIVCWPIHVFSWLADKAVLRKWHHVYDGCWLFGLGLNVVWILFVPCFLFKLGSQLLSNI